jgi:hypothetical protein
LQIAWILAAWGLVAISATPVAAQAPQEHGMPSGSGHAMQPGDENATRPMTSGSSPDADARQFVKFPEPLRLHTLANMREHLSTLQEIDIALSRNDYDSAARLAERRLGLSSLEAHGAAHLAPYMPPSMQDIGTAMHRAASRFAIVAQNAAATGDVRPALAALGDVMQQCVACHAAFRMH